MLFVPTIGHKWINTMALDLDFIVWPGGGIGSSDYMMGKRKLIERERENINQAYPQ